VGVLGGAPAAFAVSPKVPGNLKALAEASKLNSGKFNYGSPGSGTLLHVAAERLKSMSGLVMTHVPYKGSAPALQDLMGGNIEMSVDTLGSLLPHQQSGRLNIVGVATAKRLSLAPDIPTVAESAGLSQPFEAMLWNVVTAPRDTPPTVLRQLSEATQRVMSDPALISKLGSQAMFADLHVGQAAVAFVQAERAKWKPIIATLAQLAAG